MVRSTDSPGHDEHLTKALEDGLIGRRALMRAYEGVSERTTDADLKTRLAQFAEDERKEYERAVAITREHGGDPGVVHNVKEEVAAFLSKTLMRAGKEPYAAARDVAVLHGLEASGTAGAIFLRGVAQGSNDQAWASSIEESIERSREHMEFLQKQAEALGQRAREM